MAPPAWIDEVPFKVRMAEDEFLPEGPHLARSLSEYPEALKAESFPTAKLTPT